MSDYVDGLKRAAVRNGAECAEVTAMIYPTTWTEDQYGEILDHLALALVRTFPGGAHMFRSFAEVVTNAAHAGFDARARELGITLPDRAKAH